MMRYIHILLCMLLLTACYKDEVDIDALNYNPFDRDYVGPGIFEFVGTYEETVTVNVVVGTPPNQTQIPMDVVQQVIEFRVHEDLFLSPASYYVQVKEQGVDNPELLAPDPPGSDHFKFYRSDEPAWGVPVCLELRLSNNLATARMELICATL